MSGQPPPRNDAPAEILIPLTDGLLDDLADLAQLDGRTLPEYAGRALDEHVNGKRAMLDALHQKTQDAT